MAQRKSIILKVDMGEKLKVVQEAEELVKINIAARQAEQVAKTGKVDFGKLQDQALLERPPQAPAESNTDDKDIFPDDWVSQMNKKHIASIAAGADKSVFGKAKGAHERKPEMHNLLYN